MTNRNEVAERREAPLRTQSWLGAEDVRNITAELNVLLADVFALYWQVPYPPHLVLQLRKRTSHS